MPNEKVSALASATTPLGGTELLYVVQGGASKKTTLSDALLAAQPLDPLLTAVAALTTAADKLIYTTGVDTVALVDLSSFSRTLLDDTTAAAWRTTLGFDEAVDDRVAALLVAGTNVTLTYNDGAGTLTVDVSGTAAYSDEAAQDAVGGILTDSATIDFTYTDATPAITAVVVDGSITYAKMQDVSATQRVVGRNTAGAGDPEEVTYSQVLDWVGSAARGDVLYRNATVWTRLPAGTAGNVLTTGGAGADPTWSAAGSGSVTSVSVVTANGVSGSVATATTTPAVTITLGAITPTSVAASGTVTGSNLSGTNTGNQTITLTGDVTGTGTGTFAATIASDAVTYAKMQNVSATARVLGRKTAGAGDPEECSLSDVLDFVGSPAQGDVLYRNATIWTRLGAGTAGHVLTTGGAGSNPSWSPVAGTVTSVNLTAPATGITVSGGPVTVSGSITLALADDLAALEGVSGTGLAARTASNTWTTRTVTGTASRISIANGSGVSGNPTVDIDAAYVGQTSITTVGTVGIGTWSATTIALNKGGTGATTQAGAANAVLPAQTGNAGKVLTTDGTDVSWGTAAAGTVTSVSVVTANGVSGSVATSTTTPAITLTLGAITPTSVAASGTVTGSNLSGTNTGNQTITLTGDVTGSGTGSFAATVAADSVTYAKMQNVSATSRVIGRKTAGSGDPEELTFSEVLDFVGSAAQGDLLYRNATAWVRLAAGTSGQYLKTLGAGANPAWDTPAGGGSGTVTNFSAGDLTPLFTTAEATTTTTPALSFAQITKAANLVFAGPASGGAANPDFRALVGLDLPQTAPYPITVTLGGTDDMDIGGVTTRVVRLTATGDFTLTGFVAGWNGQTIQIWNATTARTFTLSHNDAGSVSANQFECSGAANITLGPRQMRHAFYDGTSSKWRVQA